MLVHNWSLTPPSSERRTNDWPQRTRHTPRPLQLGQIHTITNADHSVLFPMTVNISSWNRQ